MAAELKARTGEVDDPDWSCAAASELDELRLWCHGLNWMAHVNTVGEGVRGGLDAALSNGSALNRAAAQSH